MTLFERTARYVKLTPDGALLLPEARAIVERVDSLALLRGSSSDPRGPLRIVSFPAATIGVLPRVLPSYRATFREVDVSVETWAIESDLRPLLDRGVDIAFARGPISDQRLDAMVIAIVSAIVRSIFQAGLTVVPLKPSRWIENLCLTWRCDRANVPVIRSFRDHVANAALKFSADSNETGQ